MSSVDIQKSRSLQNDGKPVRRAQEADELLSSIKDLIVEFIQAADDDAASKAEGHGHHVPGGGPRSVLVEHHPPRKLESLLNFSLPENGLGKDGFIAMTKSILQYSVNTWDQGFLEKLYASTTPVGLAADLLLSALNTNVHVYQTSPALTLIEKHVSRALASMFGLEGAHAGGVSQPGGSAANHTSMVIARNTLFPETKIDGYGTHRFVLFTSAQGHYSVEKAAQMSGFGSKAVRTVAVDESGRMRIDALEAAIAAAKEAGETPFYVNATAGTTVLGSFDSVDKIADVCRKHNLWLHVDGSWGGPVIFSKEQRHKLVGTEKADSITICPHKMLNVPLTCSFLLGKDLRQFHKAMTLPAEYLFHNSNTAEEQTDPSAADTEVLDAHPDTKMSNPSEDIYDLADLVPQCGRRGDSLKFALTWLYYGTSGLAAYVDAAFFSAELLSSLVAAHPKFTLVSASPPLCLQVCFYFDKQSGIGHRNRNSRITETIAKNLIRKGFTTDYAPGEEGKFFRVVVNGQTRKETLTGLVKSIAEIGEKVVTSQND